MLEAVATIFTKLAGLNAMLADEEFPEFFRKKKDVSGALAQRRDVNRDNV